MGVCAGVDGDFRGPSLAWEDCASVGRVTPRLTEPCTPLSGLLGACAHMRDTECRGQGETHSRQPVLQTLSQQSQPLGMAAMCQALLSSPLF